MIRVDFQHNRITAALDQFGAAVNDGMMESVRGELERLQDDNFNRKSRGSVGTDGISWKPLSEDWVRKKGHNTIGFWKGGMRAVVDSGYSGDVVWFEYLAGHAEYFDDKRELMPVELPDAWADAMVAEAIEWADETLSELFSAA